jgi:hypothetical protein
MLFGIASNVPVIFFFLNKGIHPFKKKTILGLHTGAWALPFYSLKAISLFLMFFYLFFI